MSSQLMQSYYHLIDAAAYFIAAAVPILFIIRSRKSINNPLRAIAIILAGFVLAQGVYHVVGMLGLTLLSKVILEPLSAAILASAGVAYLLTRKRLLKEAHGQIGK